MANGITNRGRKILLGLAFRNEGITSKFKLHIVTSATTPDVDTNTLSQLTEIGSGNGYGADGIDVARSSVGFDAPAEDDSGNKATIALVDVVLTASGGPIPASGTSRYAVLTTDEATKADRQIIAWWDAQPAIVDGQSSTLQDPTIELTTPA